MKEILVSGLVSGLLSIGSALILWMVNEIKTAIVSKIKDENLQQAATIAINAVEQNLPNLSNEDKLKEAVKFTQFITPTIKVSDKKVETYIEGLIKQVKL